MCFAKVILTIIKVTTIYMGAYSLSLRLSVLRPAYLPIISAAATFDTFRSLRLAILPGLQPGAVCLCGTQTLILVRVVKSTVSRAQVTAMGKPANGLGCQAHRCAPQGKASRT